MIAVKEKFPLTGLNTFRISAIAAFYVELYNADDINRFLASNYVKIRPRFILGGGSNVLFTKDYDGIIVRPLIRGIKKVGENKDTVLVEAGAGEDWDSFVQYCVDNNWGGIENLSFIPGTIGASPVQNIGAYGVEARESIETVEGIDLKNGENICLSAKECRFSYRDSIFKHELKDKVLITKVLYRLSKNHCFKTSYPDLKKELDQYPDTTIGTIRQAIVAIRKNKLPDPAIIGNAGSFFKNPIINKEKAASLRRYYPDLNGFECGNGTIKLSAAWLIEKSGWKGKRWGRAGTHKKQPLILVNHGDATGEEILQCATKIQKAVMNHFAIKLEMEVNVL